MTTFYSAKNDHRWVSFFSLKTINSDLQQGPRAGTTYEGTGFCVVALSGVDALRQMFGKCQRKVAEVFTRLRFDEAGSDLAEVEVLLLLNFLAMLTSRGWVKLAPSQASPSRCRRSRAAPASASARRRGLSGARSGEVHILVPKKGDVSFDKTGNSLDA